MYKEQKRACDSETQEGKNNFAEFAWPWLIEKVAGSVLSSWLKCSEGASELQQYLVIIIPVRQGAGASLKMLPDTDIFVLHS